MSRRPGEWQLLQLEHSSFGAYAGDDPVPGDPDQVGAEATHYQGIARDIADQVTRLRRLADPDVSLKGQFADELHEACSDLADHLDKAHDRFATAGEQLAVLSPALSTARTGTQDALDDAVAAHAKAEKEAAADDTPSIAPGEPTNPELDAARSRARGVMSTFDDIAENVAKKIRDAADDDLKDGRWDGFKELVHKIAPVLKVISKILEIAIIVVTVAALIFSGVGIGLLVGLLVAALVVDSLLATSGDGSWFDVGMDALGLVTLGVGTKLAALAKGARGLSLAEAAPRASAAATSQVFENAALNGGRGILGRVSMFVVRRMPSVVARAETAGAEAASSVLGRGLPTVSRMESLLAGDRELAAISKDLGMLGTEFGTGVVTPAIRSTVGTAINYSRISLGFDLTTFSAKKIPAVQNFTDDFTHEIGGPW